MFVPDLMNRTNRPDYSRIPMRRQLSLRHQWLLFKKTRKAGQVVQLFIPAKNQPIL